MSMIDPTARIADGAVIGAGTEIGPYCIIGPNVVLGENCKLIAHVTISGHTKIGAGCVISPFAARPDCDGWNGAADLLQESSFVIAG